MKSIRRLLKALSFRAFSLLSRIGIYILPVHFYVPIANVHELGRTKHVWALKSDLPGVAPDLDEQAASLRRICLPFRTEYDGNLTYVEAVQQRFGPGYGAIEAQALHAVVRHYRPRRVVEVGSGVSSFCMLKALELNEQQTGEAFSLTCIEPYPSTPLRALDRAELIEQPVQTVPYATFEQLAAGDLLFIDSTHTVRPGSDVNFLVLEVLPRLATGVIVHFHDIYLPYDYPREVLRSYFQWMETSLVRAWLIDNSHARIVFCMSQLHYDMPGVMREVFPDYVPAPDSLGLETTRTPGDSFPSSLYVEIT